MPAYIDTTSSSTTSSSTTSTFSNQFIWSNWAAGTTSSMISTTSSTISTSTWTTWCSNSTQTTSVAQSFMSQVTPPPLTEEELQVRARQRAEQSIRQAEESAKRMVAEKRAEELLLENLSLRQRNEYLKDQYFVVHGLKHRYRVRKGRTGNIDVVAKDGKVLHRLCAHPGDSVPDCDTMLAQKLSLEVAEDDFLLMANVHRTYDNRQVLEPLH